MIINLIFGTTLLCWWVEDVNLCSKYLILNQYYSVFKLQQVKYLFICQCFFTDWQFVIKGICLLQQLCLSCMTEEFAVLLSLVVLLWTKYILLFSDCEHTLSMPPPRTPLLLP